MSRTTVATDDFNRASIGTDWSAVNSDFGSIVTVSSTHAEGSAQWPIATAICSKWVGSGSFNDDQWASVVIGAMSALSVDYYTGVAVRVGTGNNATRSYYGAIVCYDPSGGNNTTKLFKVVAGTTTTLNSGTVAWANGDRIDLEVEGTTLRLCKNGTPLGGAFTQTDSSLSTGLPGVVGTSSTSGDDWQAGNFITGGFLSRNYWWGNL